MPSADTTLSPQSSCCGARTGVATDAGVPEATTLFRIAIRVAAKISAASRPQISARSKRGSKPGAGLANTWLGTTGRPLRRFATRHSTPPLAYPDAHFMGVAGRCMFKIERQARPRCSSITGWKDACVHPAAIAPDMGCRVRIARRKVVLADERFLGQRSANVSPYLERPLRTLAQAERDLRLASRPTAATHPKYHELSSANSNVIPLRPSKNEA